MKELEREPSRSLAAENKHNKMYGTNIKEGTSKGADAKISNVLWFSHFIFSPRNHITMGKIPNVFKKKKKFFFLILSGPHAQRGARTHDPEIKSHMLHRLSQPGAPKSFSA